jgi:hypothetical protein
LHLRTAKIGLKLGKAAQPQTGSVEQTAEASPGMASERELQNVDVQKLSEYVQTHGAMPADPEALKDLENAVATKVVSVLGGS